MLSIFSVVQNQKTVTTLSQQVADKKKEHLFLQERLRFVKSNTYVDEEARDKLGLVKPDEHMVLVPVNTTEASAVEQIDTRPNWEKWWRLFF